MATHGNSTELGAAARARVCEHCRRLKVRCQPDPHDVSGKCQRCLKASRRCVFQKQKSQRDSDIMRLEEKIDALASIWKITSPDASQDPLSRQTQSNSGSSHAERTVQPPLTHQDKSPHRRSGARNSDIDSGDSQVKNAFTQGKAPQVNTVHIPRWEFNLSESCTSTLTVATPFGPKQENYPIQVRQDTDVVEQGIVSFQTACLFFDRYVNDMAPHLPAVIFSHESDAAYLQLTKPILFLAILSVGSGGLNPELHQVLTERLLDTLVSSIVYHGQKSLELVQAVIVWSTWYRPPPSFEQLSFQQLLATAVVMIENIIYTHFHQRSERDMALSVRNSTGKDWDLQLRRAWLGCFILCSRSSIRWGGPSLIRWTSFGADCIEVLGTVSDPIHSDLVLCQLTQYQRAAEGFTQQISGSDRDVNLSPKDNQNVFLEPKKLAFPELNRNLLEPASLIITREAVNLSAHEPVIRRNQEKQIFRAPFLVEKLRRPELRTDLGDRNVDTLHACIASAKRWLKIFLSLEVPIIRTLPSFYFSDAIYALVMLVASTFEISSGYGLDRALAFQNSQVNLHVYLLEKAFTAAAKDQNCLAAGRFCPIFNKVREKVQEGIASPFIGICGEHQGEFWKGSDAIGLDSMHGWSESSICADTELFDGIENLFPLEMGDSIQTSNMPFPPVQNSSILGTDTTSQLSQKFQMEENSWQMEGLCGMEDHTALERVDELNTGTAAWGAN